MRIYYTFHTNLKIELSISGVVLYKFRTQIEKSSLNPNMSSNFLKYLAEVVDFDPFDDATNPKLGKICQIYIYSTNNEKLAS